MKKLIKQIKKEGTKLEPIIKQVKKEGTKLEPITRDEVKRGIKQLNKSTAMGVDQAPEPC